MMQLPSDILSLTSDAAVLAKNGRIVFLNRRAEAILGKDSLNNPIRSVFGSEISDAQASSFVACVPVCGSYHTVRVSHVEGFLAVFFSPAPSLPAVNNRFLSSMRESLMGMSVSVELGRNAAADINNKSLSACFSSVSHAYYKLLRSIGSASIVLGLNDGSLPFQPTRINLAAYCRSAFDTLGSLFPDLSVISSCPDSLFCVADPALLDQLIMNLISNAIAHGHCKKISIGLIETPDSLIISFSDDGRGIPSDKLADVFDSFLHDVDLSDMYKGPGLGLSVVRGIAEKHGGTLLLESRDGLGTTVRASISKKIAPIPSLASVFSVGPDFYKTSLISLADCLPDEMFSDKYMD